MNEAAVISHDALASFSLLQDLDPAALKRVFARLNKITLAAGDYLCRQGEPGDSLFLIESGLIEVWLESSEDRHLVRRLRQGEIVGEMALLTGEPRSAHVIANVPSTVLELDASTFAAIAADHPKLLHNIARVLIRREHESAEVRFKRQRGESVALIVAEPVLSSAQKIVEAVERTSVTRPLVVDLTGSLEPRQDMPDIEDVASLLGRLDKLLHHAERVLVLVGVHQRELSSLLQHMDRAVMVMDTDGAARLDERQLSGLHADLVLIGPDPALPGATGLPHHVVRTSSSPLPQTDIQWLGRHIARTKLGLALGAGGAKGFAHVGAFSVLEKAGYVFDYIAGSSIGSILGSGIAMGMSSAELLSTAHWLMSPEVCGTYFRLIKGDEEEPGHQRFYGALTAFADKRSFSDLPVPLAVMTADLNAKRPFVFQSGAIEEALHAALAIPGLAPPFKRAEQRLVDGVTISPVPTHVLKDMGADVTVSVNLMSRDELDLWPEEEAIPPIEKNRSKTLDPMIETLIMLQLDTSVRNANAADVVISPMFAPSSWRDIHLADRFEAAGQRAARQQLPLLETLVKPYSTTPAAC